MCFNYKAMKINNVVGVKGGIANFRLSNSNIAFTRKLKKDEEKEYSNAIMRAYDYLGIQNRALIIHGPSFPADKKTGIDTKIGSPYAQKEFAHFAKLHGFTDFQVGPGGKHNLNDNSPYTSSVYEKDVRLLNPVELTTNSFANILSKKELKEFTYAPKKTKAQFVRADYDEASEISNALIFRAWENFQEKLGANDPKAKKLNEEYKQFQEDKKYWLDDYAVANMIAYEYKTDYYPVWDKKDQDIFTPAQAERYAQIQQDYAKNIELYKFGQFLLDKQAKMNKETSEIAYIDDLIVAQSNLDVLKNKDIFLEGWCIGARGGGVKNSPQLWGFPLYDPKKLFNEDGSLGVAGKYIKEKLQNSLVASSNIRIDHAMGLVNPWVYRPDSVNYIQDVDDEGNNIEYPDKHNMTGNFLEHLDIEGKENYLRIIPEIVLPTMRENGVDPNKVVWEDLGDRTAPFDRIFREQEHLTGISGLLWKKSSDAQPNNWSYIGCHDNATAQEMADMEEYKKKSCWNSQYLADRLRCDPYKYPEHEELKNKIESSPMELVKAKFSDLMRASDKIQISFSDFFGLGERYNTPGTEGNHNWTLRLPTDWEDKYYNSLTKDSFALNMPEILETAIQSKVDEEVSVEYKDYEETMAFAQPLMDELKHWSKVLKEPEQSET